MYSGRIEDDPTGANFGTRRVYRGGSWKSSMPQLRSASRDGAPPHGSREPNVGFRVARNIM